MSDIHAPASGTYGLDGLSVDPSVGRRDAAATRAAHGVSVEIADGPRFVAESAAWTNLLGRADTPNVFMDPALLRAAADTNPRICYRVLMTWKQTGSHRRLVGAWAFAVGTARHSPLPIRVINAPFHFQSHLATPVVDRDCPEAALEAMLDCIADDPELPKIAAFDMMSTGGPTYAALERVLARRGGSACVFEQSNRPRLESNLDGKAYLEKSLSSSTRKKLRQHRRRLAEKGKLEIVAASEPQAVRNALEEFLTMEAAGWKGAQGTALLSNDVDAAFIRSAIGGLVDRGCASIHSLNLDGKPISMQIVARAGSTAFTWKTTYDETFHEFSPGALLLEDYTAAFLADKSIAAVDSCSFDDTGLMSAWSERQPIADLWIDVRRGGSLGFNLVSGAQKHYRELRGAAKRAYHVWQKSRKR